MSLWTPDSSVNKIDDIDAIERYIADARPATSKGADIRKNAMFWFADQGFYARHMDTDATYTQAKSWRNEYDFAEDPKNAQKRVIEGTSNEELIYDETKPYVDPDTGLVGKQPPLIPTKYKVLAVVAAIAVGALAVLNFENSVLGALLKRK